MSDNPNWQNTFVVRLPSAIPEISRKLGFDVLQEPYLYNPEQRLLTVGHPYSLLLEGGRLWRSGSNAGEQRATKITVLPNMDGILAEFKCAQPPPGGKRDDTHYFVRVWTSEGVTRPIPLLYIWPEQWETELAACQTSPRSQ